MLKVFICGGSGYTGGELLRILSNHSEVVVTGVTSERSAGKSVTELFPNAEREIGFLATFLEGGVNAAG
jgi:N-acetyl-gamma-glutamyl-phosphate reductase